MVRLLGFKLDLPVVKYLTCCTIFVTLVRMAKMSITGTSFRLCQLLSHRSGAEVFSQGKGSIGSFFDDVNVFTFISLAPSLTCSLITKPWK